MMMWICRALCGLLIGAGTTASLGAAMWGLAYAEFPSSNVEHLGVLVGALFVVGILLVFLGHGLRELAYA